MDTTRFYYKNNLLQQLRGFYNVARFNSVTKASKKMGLVQSAISLQIKKLQDDLGVKLFENKNGKLILTEKGQDFYNKTFSIVEQTENLIKEFWSEYEEEKQNNLTIGCHDIVATYILPDKIYAISKKFKDINIKISSIQKEQSFERLIKGELDVAIYPCAINEDFPAEIEPIPFLDYNMCLAMKKTHVLAKMHSIEITMKNIIKYDVLFEEEALITSSKFASIFKENNIKSAIEFENTSWNTIEQFCIKGFGIAGFDEVYSSRIKNQDIIIKNVSHLLPKMKYFFFKRKNAPEKKVIDALLSFLK